MTAAPSLVLRAGAGALRHIREAGLQPSDIHLIPGAAGGPKALGLQGLDLALFGDWLPRVPQPRTLVGASIGSWRFASACLADPEAGLRRLGELYTIQRFPKGISTAEVSRRCRQMLDDLLEDEDSGVIANPDYRLCILANRSRGALAAHRRSILALGLLGVIGANAMSRRGLGLFLERYLFADVRQPQPWDDQDGFATHRIPLDESNLRQALLASGSIPMVMDGVERVPGAPAGVYRDGGLIDYHLDLPWRAPGVILYPHFLDRVIPGWFDKPLTWRQGHPGWLDKVLLVAPSRDYLARLPHGKLPDRKDFIRYQDDDAGRERYWRKAMHESRRLGDEFLALVESGHLADVVKPLF